MTGHFLITILASNPDRTEFYLQTYLSPLHIEDKNACLSFAKQVAEVCFAHIPEAKIEKISVKKASEAQL